MTSPAAVSGLTSLSDLTWSTDLAWTEDRPPLGLDFESVRFVFSTNHQCALCSSARYPVKDICDEGSSEGLGFPTTAWTPVTNDPSYIRSVLRAVAECNTQRLDSLTMSSPSKVHDPLFHYETHFPERLSRLHLGNEFGHSGSFKKLRKTRQRTGSRYKTQPVTFDEITEVDEEPAGSEEKSEAGSAEGPAGRSGRGLMGQFQAFSRSMDGLLPRIPEQSVQPSPGRRHHFDRPPSIPSIPERVETVSKSPAGTTDPSSPSANTFFPSSAPVAIPTSAPVPSSAPVPIPSLREDRLQRQEAVKETEGTTGQGQTTLTVHGAGEEGGGAAGGAGSSAQPTPSPSVGHRRQKVTAKARKRQKAAEDKGVGDT